MSQLHPGQAVGAHRLLSVAYASHAGRVHGWGLRYAGGDRTFAEDLVQDTFVRLAERLAAGDVIDDLGAWLYRVANNLALDRLRRERSFLGRILQRYRGTLRERRAPSPEEIVGDRRAAAQALAALGELPARQRVVLCMKLLDGKSQKEIAGVLGLSEGYVSKLLARAWDELQAAGWEAGDVEG